LKKNIQSKKDYKIWGKYSIKEKKQLKKIIQSKKNTKFEANIQLKKKTIVFHF